MKTTHYLASIGLGLLLLFPVGEAKAQTTGAETTTVINIEVSHPYVAEGTSRSNGETTTITVTASYVTRAEASLEGPVTTAPDTATTVNIAVSGQAFSGLYSGTTKSIDAGDITPVPAFTITIGAGQTTATGTFDLEVFNITPPTNSVAGGKTLKVLGTATGFTVTPETQGAPIVIIDSHVAPNYIDLSLSTDSVTEGSGPTTVTVTATVNTPGSSNVGNAGSTNVVVSVAGASMNGATAGTDFDSVGDITIAIPAIAASTAGTTSATGTFELVVTDDMEIESNEILTISGAAPGTSTRTFAVRTATLTITDNDPAVAASGLSVSLDPPSVVESSGVVTPLTVTAQAPAGMLATAATVTVSLSTSGSATATDDFTLSANEVELAVAAGGTSATGTLMLTAVDNDDADGDRTLVFTATTEAINPSTGRPFVIPDVTLTIIDDETSASEIAVSVSPSSVTESSGTTTLNVTAEALEGRLATAATVTFALETGGNAGTATINEDFTLSANSVDLVFAAGDTSATGTLELTAVDNEDENDDKTLVFTATTEAINQTTGSAFAIPGVVTLTITDDDASQEEAIQTVVPEIARASISSVVGAVSDRIGQVASGSFGQNAHGAAGLLASTLADHQQELNDGTISLQEALAGSSLAAGQAGPDMPVGVWISADYEDFSSETADLGSWDGKQRSLHAGVDRHLSATTLVGIAASWSKGDITFNEDSSLDTDTRLVGLSPYLGWHTPDGRQTVWATIGHSRGELEQEEQGLKTDLKISSLAVGGSHRITEGAGTHVNLKGDLSTAKVSTDADGGIEAMTARVHRFRLAMEAEASVPAETGGQFSYSAAIGLRGDAGAGDTGFGLEVDGSTGWTDPDRGLLVSGHGNLLLLHSGDLGEWGIGGQVRFTPKHGRGPGFRLRPVYGTAENNPGQIWDREITELDPAGEPEARLFLDTSWGRAVLSGRGLLTPYGGLELSEGGSRTYRLGTRLGIGSAFHIDLAGERTEDGGGPEHGIDLQIGMRW